MSNRIVVLSAHLDDAVLSLSKQLTRDSVQVVTVFAGIPDDENLCAEWDQLTMATSSRRRMLARREEDARALAHLGAKGLYLDELDEQYREGDPPMISKIASKIAPTIAEASEIWIPVGIGGHVDHLAARDAGLNAAGIADLPDTKISFYADIPYAIRYGWPSWVQGKSQIPFTDVDLWFRWQVANSGLKVRPEDALVYRLSAADLRVKRKAVSEYHTQLGAMNLESFHKGEDPGIAWHYEVAWRLDVSKHR